MGEINWMAYVYKKKKKKKSQPLYLGFSSCGTTSLQPPKFHLWGITIFQLFLQVFFITEKHKYGFCLKPLLMERKSALLFRLLWAISSTGLKSLHRNYFINHSFSTRRVWQELDMISSFQYNYFFMQINGQSNKVTRNSEGFLNFILEIHAKVTPANVDTQIWLFQQQAQLVKILPAMQETLVQFLGQKDLLETG